jgi:hypothetical protein
MSTLCFACMASKRKIKIIITVNVRQDVIDRFVFPLYTKYWQNTNKSPCEIIVFIENSLSIKVSNEWAKEYSLLTLDNNKSI